MAETDPRELLERLQRMEEALAFAQRDDEETLSRLVAVDQLLRDLMKRVDRIEQRTRELGEASQERPEGDPQDAPENA